MVASLPLSSAGWTDLINSFPASLRGVWEAFVMQIWLWARTQLPTNTSGWAISLNYRKLFFPLSDPEVWGWSWRAPAAWALSPSLFEEHHLFSIFASPAPCFLWGAGGARKMREKGQRKALNLWARSYRMSCSCWSLHAIKTCKSVLLRCWRH